MLLYSHYCRSYNTFLIWNPEKIHAIIYHTRRTGMEEILNADKLILCFSSHDLIAKCCTTNPWQGCYFNSALQPAENHGLRLCGSCVYVHMSSFPCVCLCWRACVEGHMWAVIGILLLSTVQRPKLCWTEKIPEPDSRQCFRALCLL